jgi:RNA polymerase sigma-70 factor (ECF subfamily)
MTRDKTHPLTNLSDLEDRHSQREFAELRERVLAGAGDAWRHFVERYSRTVYTIAYRLAGAGRDREELAQDVYLGVFERLARDDFRVLRGFRGDAKFETYLFSAVRHELAQRARSDRKDRLRVVSVDDEHDGREPSDPRGDRTTFAEMLDLHPREVAEIVDGALAKLDEQERTVLHLRFREGLPYRRLAELFDWKDTNAAAYEVSRALRKLDRLARSSRRLRWGEAERRNVLACLGRWLRDDPEIDGEGRS